MNGKMRLTEAIEALHTADGADAQIAAVATYEHAKATKGKRTSPERIPTCQAMVDWLPVCPEHAWRDMWHRMPELETQDGVRSRSGSTWLCAVALSASMNWRWRIGKGLWHGDPREGVPRFHWEVTSDSLAEAIQGVHSSWMAIPETRRGPHPLGPLVLAWMDRSVSVTPDTREQGIMPQGLFSAAPSHRVVAMPDRSDTSELPGPGRVTDQELPTLFPLAGPQRPAPLVLADYAGMTELVRGRGARLDKRILIYSLLSMPLERRYPGARFELRGLLRELTQELWPTSPKTGRSSYTPSMHGSKLLAALEGMSLAKVRIPPEHGGGFWAPAVVRRYPDLRSLDSEYRIQIELPDSCDRGPRIHRPSLRAAGVISDPAYDLWLSLAYVWDRAKASNGGYRIHATRPKARRDTDGCLLDAHGLRVLRKDGSPVRDWRHKRAVLDGEERHPQANRVPALSRLELHRMAYGGRPAPALSQFQNEVSRLRKLLKRWEREGRVVIEIEGHGRHARWRVLEPHPTAAFGAVACRIVTNCLEQPNTL